MCNCKKCNSDTLVKARFIRGFPRFKCKNCRSYEIIGDKRCKYSDKIRRIAVLMYLKNLGLRNIGKILEIPYQTIAKWIKKENMEIQEKPDKIRRIEVLEIDEIVTFCKKNSIKFGFRLQSTEIGIKFLILK